VLETTLAEVRTARQDSASKAATAAAAERNRAGRPGTSAASGAIAVDSTPVTSGDGIELTGLKAEGAGGPPSVGDTITVSFSLTNAGSQPVRLAATFVGARNEAGDHRDSEQLNLDRTLAPGETVATQDRVVVDSAGRWRLWPCYELDGGATCPDEWQAFPVAVG
jgi:hypothetical protein